MQDKTRAHIFVSGRVQGVFFRASTVEEAKKVGVSGWVRNLDDGRVEILIEGDKSKVNELIEWVKRGPSAAEVENIDIQWQEHKDEFKNFQELR